MLRRLVSVVVVLLAFASAAHGATYLRLGFDDDQIKWQPRPNGFVWAQRQLGAPFTRITIPWKRGQVKPNRLDRTYLLRARLAGDLWQKVVIAIYGVAAQAPTDPVSRDQFCRFARAAVAQLPYMSAVVIWNEANSPAYWPQSAGAPAYEALLARCYDVLHAYRPNVNVIDSTAAHYDPAKFIVDLGAAYRASGRPSPLVDTFGHNPYPDNAAEPPSATHAPGTIGEGDYQTLIGALTTAFAGTGQPVPSADWPRIWYLEDGFQTGVPRSLAWRYHGSENDRSVLPPEATDGASQASQLTAAISLAYCQPAVSAFFNFKLLDESRLGGWQSGLMYANGVPKPSFYAYQQVSAAVANHTIDCTKVAGAPQPPATPVP